MCYRGNIPHNNSKASQQTDENLRAAIKNILKDLEEQFIQKYADIRTFPFAKTTWNGTIRETVSGYQGQKREGLFRLCKFSRLIYTGSHTELWTLNWSFELAYIIKHGAPQMLQGQRRARLGWLSATCCVNRCPKAHGVTKPLPPPPLLFLLLVGWHQAGSCRQLIPSQLSEGWGAATSNASLAGKGGLLRRRPCPGKQQHWGNQQLKITCSPRLTPRAVCQPLQQWQVILWEPLQPKSHPFHPEVFPAASQI